METITNQTSAFLQYQQQIADLGNRMKEEWEQKRIEVREKEQSAAIARKECEEMETKLRSLGILQSPEKQVVQPTTPTPPKPKPMSHLVKGDRPFWQYLKEIFEEHPNEDLHCNRVKEIVYTKHPELKGKYSERVVHDQCRQILHDREKLVDRVTNNTYRLKPNPESLASKVRNTLEQYEADYPWTIELVKTELHILEKVETTSEEIQVELDKLVEQKLVRQDGNRYYFIQPQE